VKAERATGSKTWADVLKFWALIEADLHERYGIDVDDRAVLRARSWRWLQVRILGLLSAETRLHRALFPEQHEHERG
jgi:hypothetical protein